PPPSRSLRPRRRGRPELRSRRGWLRGASGSPRGGTLVEERAQTFLAFRARAQLRRQTGRPLAVRPLADQSLRRACRFRARAQQLTDEAVDRGVQVGRALMDEADSERRLGGGASAGQ